MPRIELGDGHIRRLRRDRRRHDSRGRLLPDYGDVRGWAREVRRVAKLNGHPISRGTVEYAYDLALAALNGGSI